MRKNQFLVICGMLLLIFGVAIGRYTESVAYQKLIDDVIQEYKITSLKLSSLKTDLDSIDNDLFILKQAVGVKKTAKVTPTPTPTPTPAWEPKPTTPVAKDPEVGISGPIVDPPVDKTETEELLSELSSDDIKKLIKLLDVIE